MTNCQPEDQILVAAIIAPHGIAGALSVESYSDNPNRFEEGAILTSETGAKLRIEKASTHKGRLLLVFEDIATRNDAEKLRGQKLYVSRDQVPPLPEGTFYHFQLIGMKVRENGVEIGKIVDVLPYTANDIYVMEPTKGKEKVLIPALKSVVRRVDVEEGCMDVELPEGLRNEN